MRTPNARAQRGQILVIFAGGLVLLLLIAGLVFDPGMAWMMRRQEQNAADPAALAAAKYIPTVTLPLTTGNNATGPMVSAACFYADANGLFPSGYDLTSTGCKSKTDPYGFTLTVFYPPAGASGGEYAGRPGFVQVVIARQKQNSFLSILGQPIWTVSASAVAANTTGDSNSYSLLALDPNHDCGSGKLGGNGGGGAAKVTIAPAADVSAGTGGYVQVNSTCGGVPNPPQTAACPGNGTGALQVSGGSSISAPSIFTTGTCGSSGTITTNAGSVVTQGALQVGDPLADLKAPMPSDYPAGQCNGVTTSAAGAQGCTFNSAGTYVLAPGTYYGGWNIGNNVTLELSAGIYVIAGGGISLNAGGSITSVSAPGGSPAPVMIFSTDDPNYQSVCLQGGGSQKKCQGAVDLTAQSTLDLTALNSGPYKGIVLWQDGNGSCTGSNCSVTVGGQTTMTISGTIYAPKVLVTLTGGGAAGGTAAVQIISWQWNIGGGSNLTMPYDPSQLYHLEQRGLVH